MQDFGQKREGVVVVVVVVVVVAAAVVVGSYLLSRGCLLMPVVLILAL